MKGKETDETSNASMETADSLANEVDQNSLSNRNLNEPIQVKVIVISLIRIIENLWSMGQYIIWDEQTHLREPDLDNISR